MHGILFPLCYTRSARHFPPSRDCGLCHLSIPCWFSPFLFRLAPRHDGGLREGFDVDSSCHSACVALQFAFLHLAPPATLAVHGTFLTVVCLIIVSAFPSMTFLRVFPGFIARPFRGVGVGLTSRISSTHVLVSGAGISPNFPYFFIHMRLVRVG